MSGRHLSVMTLRRTMTRPHGALLRPAMRMIAEIPIMMTGQRPVLVVHLLMSVMMGGICSLVRSLTVKT